MEDFRPRLGARVRARRKELGLTQEQLAEAADMHWTFISGVERGLRDPRLNTIGKIATALDTPIEELLRDHGSGPKPSGRRTGRKT